MRKKTIIVLTIVITNLWACDAQCDIIVYNDDFSTDTTSNYSWWSDDYNPSNHYTYDAVNEWVTITTGDNNNMYMRRSLDAFLLSPLELGYFEFSFMPWQIYETDGLVEMRLYGSDTSDMYIWHFAHNSGLPDGGYYDQYRARLEKWVDGTPVIQEIFIPTPDHYDLGQWHTLAMSFSPTNLSGYLDGQLILSVSDPTMTPLTIRNLQLVFSQQDQHIDNILITTIPTPGAVLLGSIGLSLVGWRLRKREES